MNLQEIVNKLEHMGLTEAAIEDLYLNPNHSIYFSKPGQRSVWLIELELNESGSIDILVKGRSIGFKCPLAGSRESLNRIKDKTIIHPIEVFHSFLDIDTITSYIKSLNNEPDFTVLYYRVSSHPLANRIDVLVEDFVLNKLDHYADRIQFVLGDYCQRVCYHSFEVSWGSPDFYFSKGYPSTISGMIIEKFCWNGKKYVRTKNDLNSISSFLKEKGFYNIRVINDNPEFWKITFESHSLWADNLYCEMQNDGFDSCRIYSDACNSSFVKESYPRAHWKIVSVKKQSDIDDEETVMRAISGGYGEPYGRG